MKNINDYFRITYESPVYGDCTYSAVYEAIKPVTVQELCDYILSNDREWGCIGIAYPGMTFGDPGDPNIEYFHGEYVDKKRNPIEFKFPLNIANAIVKRIDWHGGWSNADWILTLQKQTKRSPAWIISTKE